MVKYLIVMITIPKSKSLLLSVFIVILASVTFVQRVASQSNIYFPPIVGNEWETVQPESLGWCQEELIFLDQFLVEKGTKAFIILKNGRIAHERYFGSFTRDSVWYWASAGKSLTAFLAGLAIDEGVLNIEAPVSEYLGKGWTSTTEDQESAIKVWHQMTMTTGLEGSWDNDCKDPECLLYRAAPGTRWFYYNAPYLLVHDVIEKASGMNYQQFTNRNLSLKTGITGLWLNGVFFSRARSMARFGLLMLNNGNWNNDIILRNKDYHRQMIESSQDLNPAYGLLWWLNGKNRFRIPVIDFTFNGKLVPNAPDDMYCALGKDDQKIYVVPSQNLIVVRMGNSAGEVAGAITSFDNQLWRELDRVFCNPTSLNQIPQLSEILHYPNPASDILKIEGATGHYRIIDIYGRSIMEGVLDNGQINISVLPVGTYILQFLKGTEKSVGNLKFVKM